MSTEFSAQRLTDQQTAEVVHVLVGLGAGLVVIGLIGLAWMTSRGSAKRQWELQRAQRIADGILTEAKRRRAGLTPRPYPRRFGHGWHLSLGCIIVGGLVAGAGGVVASESEKAPDPPQAAEVEVERATPIPGLGDCVDKYYVDARAEAVPSVPCNDVGAVAQVVAVAPGAKCKQPFRLADSDQPNACLRRYFRKGDCMPAWVGRHHRRGWVYTVYTTWSRDCAAEVAAPERPESVPAKARWGKVRVRWVRPWHKGPRWCLHLLRFKAEGVRVCVKETP